MNSADLALILAVTDKETEKTNEIVDKLSKTIHLVAHLLRRPLATSIDYTTHLKTISQMTLFLIRERSHGALVNAATRMALMLSAVSHMAVLDLKVDEPTDGFVMSTFVYAHVDAVSLLKAVPTIYAVGTYGKEYLLSLIHI